MHNGGVDAAARIHSSITGRIKLRNTPPPLASNDLFGRAAELNLDTTNSACAGTPFYVGVEFVSTNWAVRRVSVISIVKEPEPSWDSIG